MSGARVPDVWFWTRARPGSRDCHFCGRRPYPNEAIAYRRRSSGAMELACVPCVVEVGLSPKPASTPAARGQLEMTPPADSQAEVRARARPLPPVSMELAQRAADAARDAARDALAGCADSAAVADAARQAVLRVLDA